MLQPRSAHAAGLSALAACTLCLAPAAQAAFLFGRLVPNPPALEANAASNQVDVSADGRTLVFTTLASNWTADGNGPNSKIIATDMRGKAPRDPSQRDLHDDDEVAENECTGKDAGQGRAAARTRRTDRI